MTIDTFNADNCAMAILVPCDSPTVVFETEGVPCPVAYQVGDVLYWDLLYLYDELRDKSDMSSWKFLASLRRISEQHPHLGPEHVQIRGKKDRRGKERQAR